MSWVQAPAAGDPSAKCLPSESANQDLSPGKPSAALSPGFRAEQGRQGVPVLPEVEGEEPGRLATSNFLACRTGSLDADNMGQGLQGSLDFSHHGPGRMWLSLGEIGSALPAQLLLSPRPLADDIPVKGPAHSTCQLLSGCRLSQN